LFLAVREARWGERPLGTGFDFALEHWEAPQLGNYGFIEIPAPHAASAFVSAADAARWRRIAVICALLL
jgi:hypothetical protein